MKPQTFVRRTLWFMLMLAATGLGVVSLRYLLPHVAFALTGSNMEMRRQWVVAHATFASLAILIGPWQFISAQGPRRVWHRFFGRCYLVAVFAGWVASVPIAMHAQTGLVAQLGFLTLGIAWVTTSALAYVTIRRGDVRAHRAWMVRSYALTCAAISLRLMVALTSAAGLSFETSYPEIAWACWLVNLAIAECWLRFAEAPRPAIDAIGVAAARARPSQR